MPMNRTAVRLVRRTFPNGMAPAWGGAAVQSGRPTPALWKKAWSMPEQIDIQIGRRVRVRRRLLDLTQQQLGQACGVGFQMVQKYECGLCRISASRLWALSQVLGVSVGYFYEGILPLPKAPVDEAAGARA